MRQLRCIRIIAAILAALFIFVAGVITGTCFAWLIKCFFAAAVVFAALLLAVIIALLMVIRCCR